jgi:hypothetical protein
MTGIAQGISTSKLDYVLSLGLARSPRATTHELVFFLRKSSPLIRVPGALVFVLLRTSIRMGTVKSRESVQFHRRGVDGFFFLTGLNNSSVNLRPSCFLRHPFHWQGSLEVCMLRP